MKGIKTKLVLSLFAVIFGLGVYKSYQITKEQKKIEVQEEIGVNEPPKYSYTSKANLTKSDLERISDEIKLSIEKDGAEEAYEELKEKYGDQNFLDRHNIAHLFGEILYKLQGFEAVEVCDDAFARGCFMGMFIMSMQDRGLEAIDSFEEVCESDLIESTQGCQHGVGHALQRYLGPERLTETLEICEDMGWYGPMGCAGGAFMEYFLPEWYGGDIYKAKARTFREDNPYDVCLSVPAKYQSACIFRITEWWGEVTGYDFEMYKKYCSDLDNSVLRNYCFMGAGSSLLESFSYDQDKLIDACDQVGSVEDIRYCKIGASWRAYGEDDGYICGGSDICVDKVERYLDEWGRNQ